MKKFTIYFVPYNGADEIVKCRHSHEAVACYTSADRLDAHKDRLNCVFENAWYNASIRSIRLAGIEVTYTDGTTQSCKGNYVPTEEEKKIEKRESKKALTGCLIFVLIWLALVTAVFILPNINYLLN